MNNIIFEIINSILELLASNCSPNYKEKRYPVSPKRNKSRFSEKTYEEEEEEKKNKLNCKRNS
ncbi:MAG: hypothetical protein JSS63_10985 [Bacteroidetes bacterium]|nr:hypothetical protein [Bacteroidota bacterium]